MSLPRKKGKMSQEAGGDYESLPRSPLYSTGTNEMDANERDSNSGASNAKGNMFMNDSDQIEGPTGGKSVPDPIGYLGAGKQGAL